MDRSLRICFFIRDLSAPAGTERITTVLANHLQQSGYSVDIITLTTTKSFFELDSRIGLHALGATSDRRFLLLYPFYLYKLLDLIKQRKYNVVINVAVMMIFATWIVKVIPRCALISWEHYNIHTRPRAFISAASRRLALIFSAKVVLLTHQDKELYEGAFGESEKLEHIPNPVTISSLEKANPEHKRVIAIGRYTAQKGFDLLLEAWKIVSEKAEGWDLLLVGDGEDKEMLKRKCTELGITDRVCFTMPTSDVISAYKQASIYALSSRFEGMPLVLLEAMHMGLPLVAFNCEYGPSELITNGYNGLLVENGQTVQLAEALLDLIQDDEKRTAMSKNALIASEKYSINSVALKWVTLFDALDGGIKVYP